MFEHLDDPRGFDASDRLRADVVRTGRRRRRARRLAAGGVGVVAIVAASALAAYAYVDRKVDRIDRIQVDTLAPEPPDREPYVVLLVGLDDASGLPPDAPARTGREGVVGQRADSMVLARVEPGADRVTTMAVPRDLLVDGPDGPTRINGLWGAGVDAVVGAIDTELGIDVHRVVVTDLAGAVAVADALGGVRLSFDHPVRDGRSGLALPAGCSALTGEQLLALGRSRALEAQGDDGRWMTDPTGDLGRIARQEPIVTAGLAAFSRLDTSSPSAVDELLDAVVDHVTIDSAMAKDELLDLFRHIAGSELRRLTLPVFDSVHEGMQVLVPATGADGVAATFLDAPGSSAPSPDPSGGATTGDGPGPIVPTPC